MPKTAEDFSVNCPLCERNYPLNEALMHSSFLCMNCGTLIRASAILQPGHEQVSAKAASCRPFEPLDLDVIGNDAIDRPAVIRRKPGPKGMGNLTKASIAITGGAVAILFIVVVGMLANKALSGPSVSPVLAVPVSAPPKEAEAPAKRDQRIAWEQAERLVGEIAANKKEVIRLQNALREATSKFFTPTQRELEAARARGKELVEQEAKWRAQYERLSREMGL